MSGTGIKNILMNVVIIYILITSGVIGIISFDKSVGIYTVNVSGIIIVDVNGHGNYTKIQNAIDNASSGDAIYVWAGTYY
jgi:hypothetical protein